MKKYILLIFCSATFLTHGRPSEEFIEEVQQRIEDVRAGKSPKEILNTRTNAHCEPPLFHLTRQDFWLKKYGCSDEFKLYAKLIHELLELGADPNVSYNGNTDTILGNAVLYADVEIVEALCKAGANPNLHVDAKNCSEPILNKLLNHIAYAQFNYPSTDNSEWIHKIKLLKQFGVNTSLRMYSGDLFSLDGKKLPNPNALELIDHLKSTPIKNLKEQKLFANIEKLLTDTTH